MRPARPFRAASAPASGRFGTSGSRGPLSLTHPRPPHSPPQIHAESAGTCLAPSKTVVYPVPGGKDVAAIGATGDLVFFCDLATGLLSEHNEIYTDLRSADGVWTGYNAYAEQGEITGLPFWNVKNRDTGEEVWVWGENVSAAKQEVASGVPFTRRVMYGQNSTLPTPSWPQINWVTRTETALLYPKPVDKGGCTDDVRIPMTATYTFITCDAAAGAPPSAPVDPNAPVDFSQDQWWLNLPAAGMPAPAPVAAVAVAAAAPAPAFAPVFDALPPAPTPAPIVAPVLAAPAPASGGARAGGALVAMSLLAVALL